MEFFILLWASQRLRRKGLSEPTWTLDKLVEYGRALELSETQARDIERAPNSSQVRSRL